jgi:hypothetical protein
MAGLALLFSCGVALPDDMTGQASIIDGDTLEIHGTRIRLWGIDAPESSQLCRGEDSKQYRCGAQATNDLDALAALALHRYRCGTRQPGGRKSPWNAIHPDLTFVRMRSATTCGIGRSPKA